MILQESQTVEFKESWRDEFLNTVCAFANTDGGTLYISKLEKHLKEKEYRDVAGG